jgi:tetratricopeptide (TPR) repeat protein
MKALPFLLLILSAAPLFGQLLVPKDPKADRQPAVQPEMPPAQRAFLNLPEERRMEFAQHITRAVELFQLKRLFEALDEITKAELIFDQNADLLNLKGSVYVEMRNFDKALEAYLQADKFVPNNQSILFNIAEVYFVTQQWEEAHKRFEAIVANTNDENLGFKRIAEFKLMLIKQRLGKDKEVAALLDKYDFLDDSPYHYYAEAAKAYEAKDVVKAEEWLARAARVFEDPNILAPWQDTMVEYGYIQSFYGQGNETE